MKKKIPFILIGCMLLGLFLFSVNSKETKETNVGKDNEFTQKEETEDKQDVVREENEIDPFNKLPEYEEEGIQCKSIEETLERGDCFQEINSKYLVWFMDTAKQEFFFPFQREQDHWKDVLYLTVNAKDELGDVNETEYYDSYVDPHTNSESNSERGMKILNDYWYIFSGFFPQEYRKDLKHVYWTDTGEDFVYAVGRDEKNLQDTVLMLSHHIGEYRPSVKYTLIHEFGHVLTLSEDQVRVDEEVFLSEDEEAFEAAEANCSTYYPYIGCPNEDSYLSQYYKAFWMDIEDDFNQIDWETEEDYKAFFYENEERFFNSYQGSNPVEDIADAFTFFVMTHSNEIEGKADLKYSKLEFFYQYEELVELRTMILENMYDLSVEDGVLY
ncbi:hypothetical protein CIL05_05015 [Virgibacillus profundi]|uniref:Uncharacterized protein n=1 Tax=Virgibacillus profundi TaxID=2024555 RepID=A0A2A2IFN3_9BACI|nr:hypothetical protein [Virgibacillus profundi]PAV30467.1 hypothetical protein CIL05_05015 [Virgibacillus profundi]PXY54639.1 hypothetical protein CIT14_05100 [Virgibacillus profundi]